jgi:hypothetical protein
LPFLLVECPVIGKVIFSSGFAEINELEELSFLGLGF